MFSSIALYEDANKKLIKKNSQSGSDPPIAVTRVRRFHIKLFDQLLFSEACFCKT